MKKIIFFIVCCILHSSIFAQKALQVANMNVTVPAVYQPETNCMQVALPYGYDNQTALPQCFESERPADDFFSEENFEEIEVEQPPLINAKEFFKGTQCRENFQKAKERHIKQKHRKQCIIPKKYRRQIVLCWKETLLQKAQEIEDGVLKCKNAGLFSWFNFGCRHVSKTLEDVGFHPSLDKLAQQIFVGKGPSESAMLFLDKMINFDAEKCLKICAQKGIKQRKAMLCCEECIEVIVREFIERVKSSNQAVDRREKLSLISDIKKFKQVINYRSRLKSKFNQGGLFDCSELTRECIESYGISFYYSEQLERYWYQMCVEIVRAMKQNRDLHDLGLSNRVAELAQEVTQIEDEKEAVKEFFENQKEFIIHWPLEQRKNEIQDLARKDLETAIDEFKIFYQLDKLFTMLIQQAFIAERGKRLVQPFVNRIKENVNCVGCWKDVLRVKDKDFNDALFYEIRKLEVLQPNLNILDGCRKSISVKINDNDEEIIQKLAETRETRRLKRKYFWELIKRTKQKKDKKLLFRLFMSEILWECSDMKKEFLSIIKKYGKEDQYFLYGITGHMYDWSDEEQKEFLKLITSKVELLRSVRFLFPPKSPLEKRDCYKDYYVRRKKFWINRLDRVIEYAEKDESFLRHIVNSYSRSQFSTIREIYKKKIMRLFDLAEEKGLLRRETRKSPWVTFIGGGIGC